MCPARVCSTGTPAARAAVLLHLLREHPKDITLEWSVPKRTGKIFIDHNMNRQGANIAAAYSVRPEPRAPVSTPLTWDEVFEGGFDLEQVDAMSVAAVATAKESLMGNQLITGVSQHDTRKQCPYNYSAKVPLKIRGCVVASPDSLTAKVNLVPQLDDLVSSRQAKHYRCREERRAALIKPAMTGLSQRLG